MNKFRFHKIKILPLKLILVIYLLISFTVLLWWTDPHFLPQGSISIWDRNGILLFEYVTDLGKKQPISFADFPPHLIHAVVASEDAGFWTNPGVDAGAIVRAVIQNLEKGQIVSGASTITQQLVRSTTMPTKNLSAQKNPIRKVREIFMALRLNMRLSKQEILTDYLNEMYFGNLAYGIQSGAQFYFNKDAKQLSLAESALLIGLIPQPDSRNPLRYAENAKIAQKEVLSRMVKQRYISEDQALVAQNEPLAYANSYPQMKAPHFVSYIKDQLDGLGIDIRQGLKVYTTLDYPTFTLSEEIARSWIDKLAPLHDLSNASLVLIKNDTGEILDMLGGTNYFAATSSGQVNMAVSPRQPGSTLKPITYAVSFAQGFNPATLLYDVRKTYLTKKGEGFSPNNYDGRFHGLILVREALGSSLNVPAIDMLDRIGIENFLKTAVEMGITTFADESRYDLAITLGGAETKLVDLTNVYATFARGGRYILPYAISKITNDQGKLIYQHKDVSAKAVFGEKSQQIAFLITDILADPKARILSFGEKNPLVLSRPAAAKTGTTTDWHDNWTFGYTPTFTVGVWVGNNDNHPMRSITGIVGAAPIWNQFFEEFLKDKPLEQFTKPVGIKEVEICKSSGQLPDGLCPEKIKEYFIDGTQPNSKSTLHKIVNIDIRNNLLAGNCNSPYIKEKIFVDYPPQVYSWAVAEHLETIPQQFSPLCAGDLGTSDGEFIEVTSPINQAVFESAPKLLPKQAVVFEVKVSADIHTVSWYVDQSLYQTTVNFPFQVSWKPVVGSHSLKAIGHTVSGTSTSSTEVKFSVVDYKSIID